MIKDKEEEVEVVEGLKREIQALTLRLERLEREVRIFNELL